MDLNYKLKNIEYYSITGSLGKDLNNNFITENEIIYEISINFTLESDDVIILGFMIDETRNDLLN